MTKELGIGDKAYYKGDEIMIIEVFGTNIWGVKEYYVEFPSMTRKGTYVDETELELEHDTFFPPIPPTKGCTCGGHVMDIEMHYSWCDIYDEWKRRSGR